MKTDSKLLTAKECANYIGISNSYFYKLRKRYPDLPYRSSGYCGQEVLAFLLSQGGNVKSMKTDAKLLTAKECANYIGISNSYFYKLRKRYPDLPYRSFGKDEPRYYYGQEVLDFLLSKGGNAKE